MRNIYKYLVFFFIPVSSLGQITITEVYYDTPYNERLRRGLDNNVEAIKHHRGEFIELYNNSDKDINLKGWYLSDMQDTFWLPDKIIKSGEFVLVAYSVLLHNRTDLTEHFTTLKGKENQIIYQDKILLRNKKETIKLGYSFNGYRLYNKDYFTWEYRRNLSTNYVGETWRNPEIFYTVKSIQYNPNYSSGVQDPDDIYDNYRDYPTPLGATIKPLMVNYDDTVKEDFQKNYGYLDWGNNVKKLRDNACLINVETVVQIPSGTYTSGNKCFNYDLSGNNTSSSDCNSAPSTNSATTSGYTFDQVDEISNNIIIYPNPTQSQVTIAWSGPALNKIYNLDVFNAGGGLVYNYKPIYGVNSATFTLQNQLPGVFVANFILNTGQVVSKKILKL